MLKPEITYPILEETRNYYFLLRAYFLTSRIQLMQRSVFFSYNDPIVARVDVHL